MKMTYKPFEDDETDVGYREAEAFALMLQEQAITDIKSAAGTQALASARMPHFLKPVASSTFRSAYEASLYSVLRCASGRTVLCCTTTVGVAH